MLPRSIGNLSSVQMFEAVGCNLKGKVPSEIRNMRKLFSLMVGHNNFTGIASTTLSSVKNLQHLSLVANRISGPFPIVLCELPNLSILRLSHNQMWGNIPSCLGDITTLRKVYLDSNNFTASIPSSIWNLKDILELKLSSNFFNGSLSLEIGNLKAVILLDLSSNQISGNIPSALGGLQRLIQLSLSHNRIEGSIPDTFGELISLEALDLSYNKMSGVIPKSLEALKQLDSFNVSFNRLHGEIPSGGPFVNLTFQSFMSNEGLCGLGSAIVFLLMRHRGKTVNAEDEWLPEVAPQRIFCYELQRATQDFDGNNLLGSGSFGSVYKGTLTDGTVVAVKVFNVQLEAPVIHCDLKPSNVLLDNNMVGHLTDFGIAKLLTKEESVAHTTTFATIGYIAPEYGLEGLISKRFDVYSYGIMLLETSTKKKPNDEMFTGDLNFRSCAHNLLPDELDQIINVDLLTLDEENLSQKLQSVSSIMELAMNCTTNIPVERMNMIDVVAALKRIKQKLSSCN
ncbi:receptor kinase-like protein Xa21 [Lycium ferocissimum]|uniref:receptor kinase-like protein Xa21 n=1 Tax=Lycium ferocissimum TaxID=112874 RepID=UPI0028160128|nr:receptor kinase-like protein Xa21 [Lycium ferocissimum]